MKQLRHVAMLVGVCVPLVVWHVPAAADWKSWLKTITADDNTAAVVSSGIGQREIADGLRAALEKGVQNAVSQLGRPDGFLANAKLKIPVPEHLQLVENGLRSIGQGAVADQFVSSLNRAAEQAVPLAGEVFGAAISKMTIDDARAILDGTDTAATDYLRNSSNAELKERFTPLVDDAVRQAGATKRYQDMLDKAGPIASLIDTDKLDLSNYVTDRALDGLYQVIGNEEQRIRADPAARGTELLKRVFGS